MDTVIKVEHLSKQYRIGAREGYRTFRETLVDAAKAPFVRLRGALSKEHRAESSSDSSPKSPDSTLSALSSPLSAVGGRSSPELIWALRDVSFEVKQGEVVGIIGRNGAGKSTLLKILSRITEPTEGRVELRGRVGSLLEVGTGFHPELTGHENIYLYGAILGMDRWEVTRKFDEIVAFAELEKFIDTPVKKYSSGMYMRLAFAVAAHLEPEILLVDEVLAVGDAAFQKKCLGKMGNVSKQGRTVLFVSHNLAAIEGICERGVLLDLGSIAADTDSKSAITRYTELTNAAISSVPLVDRQDRSGSGKVVLTGFGLEDSYGNRMSAARTGQDVSFIFSYESREKNPLSDVDVGFGLYSNTGYLLFVLYASYTAKQFDRIPSKGSFRCEISKLPLAAGRYLVGARILVRGDEADWPQEGIGYFNVEAGDFFGTGNSGFKGCPFLVSGKWSVSQDEIK